ncbi:MAG TPA: HEAT repeat domain-containing protein [Nitrospira sp.]|nr:HEAT repeat domain-containing protein [Nitrospira sp.]
MFTKSVILFIALVLASIPRIADASFESGVAAFKKADYQTAYQALHPLAEDGDPKAQYYIGFMHYSGKGVNQDSTEALKWVKPAAESGLAEAQYLFAMMNEEGLPEPNVHGKEKGKAKAKAKAKVRKVAHKEEAIKWLTLASEQGHVTAQVKLAERHLHGQGVPQDMVQAYAWCGIAQLLAPSRCNPQEYIPTYRMTAAQQDEAKQRVQAWLTAHPVNNSRLPAKSAQQLIAELDTADHKKREEIKVALILMGDSALPAIADAFRATPLKHTDFLAGVLCERGPAAASLSPQLIRMFRNPAITPSVKHHFLSSIACIGSRSPEVEAFMISQLKEGDDSMRPWAVRFLGRFDSQNVVLALAGSLSDSKRTVREAAAEVLTEMGPKAAPAIPALAKAMDQKGTYLSMLAGNALQAIGTPEALAEVKKRDTTSGSTDGHKEGDATDMFQ